MCFEETCVPLCSRWPQMNEPYCIKRNGAAVADLDENGRKKEAVQPTQVVTTVPCEQGNTYVAGVGNGVLGWLLGLVGFDVHSQYQKASECADYRQKTTGKSYYVNTQCENISDGLPPVVMSCYYKVIEGVR